MSSDTSDVYKQFKLDEPWDSEHNKTLIDKMPAVFASPGKPAPAGHTYLRSFVGKSAFLPEPAVGPFPTSLAGRKEYEIADGTAIAVAEATEPVIWTKPDELAFDGKELPKLGGVFDGGFHGLMADNAVYFFPKEVTTDDMLRKLISIDDGQPVDRKLFRKAIREKDEEYLTWPPPPSIPASPPPKQAPIERDLNEPKQSDTPKPPVAKPPG